MKCEHGKEVKIIFQFNGEYWDDGGYVLIEGCDSCSENVDIEYRNWK